MDLLAAVTGPLTLPAHGALAVPTGIAIALVDGYEAQIRPRSGLALNANIGVINSPGTVDSDYRGEIKVILSNFSDTPYTIHRGDRIAQMIIARYEKVKWERVDELPASGRAAGGFGHTGR
jgi:dUTP pyrophosphatase